MTSPRRTNRRRNTPRRTSSRPAPPPSVDSEERLGTAEEENLPQAESSEAQEYLSANHGDRDRVEDIDEGAVIKEGSLETTHQRLSARKLLESVLNPVGYARREESVINQILAATQYAQWRSYEDIRWWTWSKSPWGLSRYVAKGWDKSLSESQGTAFLKALREFVSELENYYSMDAALIAAVLICYYSRPDEPSSRRPRIDAAITFFVCTPYSDSFLSNLNDLREGGGPK
ncbi:hypothetical protein Pmar_PMAR001324 [Perkinsus marinus ATCC 50983]|uniref:Uncharacterized protein n=1 Tax=Perkinsus marinus (strain ATCC 50983 / TXsc) TaxID=423536 RepID=C5LZ77_PERM5|nr:hypothetical protein Pmar_PMAR001324 [Perkinsus marinus ATCC 50983]EEQ97966.1 hypothetical protein Pmar_PMAR001324 [Perkinsus marinus ATCC 50983]|eukprot:XP_002765249.1 hypothetical protein Pmar_PMAR001324 [Perkinsus marinus ATCC 50983]